MGHGDREDGHRDRGWGIWGIERMEHWDREGGHEDREGGHGDIEGGHGERDESTWACIYLVYSGT